MNFVKHLRKKRINIRRSNIRKKENLQILHADINRLSTYSHSSLSNFLQDNPDRFETFSHSAHLWRHLYHLHETSKLFRSYDNSHDCFSRLLLTRKKLFRILFSSCRTSKLQKGVPFTRLELYVTIRNDE